MLQGLVIAPGLLTVNAADETLPAYLDTSLSYKERAADLVSRMSLAEKQSQLKPPAPAIPRLGLKSYTYQNEALHGIAKNEGGVSFPSPIATASSWNRDLMLKVGQIVGDEIRAYYNATPGRGLSYYSPTMNLLRDPRWGRNEEAYSEDPFLTAVMGEMFVQGMQGIGDGVTNPNAGAEFGTDYIKIAPTLKHYAANNSERNRNSGTYDIDDKTLRDYYTWAFQRIVEKTDVASVMSSYNRVNEVPASANDYLLTKLLRQTFGFTGFVVNDCGAILDQVNNHRWVPKGADHSVTYPEAVAYSIKAGNNMDCGGGGSIDWAYDKFTVAAVDEGLISEDEIDHNLMEILLTRFKTGEFDGPADASGIPTMLPYQVSDGYEWVNSASGNDPEKLPESRYNRDATLEAAVQGAVLLKNNNSALPININNTNIKVFGPLMDAFDLGDYSGSPKTDRITFRDGMTMLAAEKGQADNVSFYQGMTPAANSSTDLLRVRAIGFYPGSGIVNAASGGETYDLSKSGDYLANVRDGSYIKFSGIDIGNMTSEEVRIFSASNNSFKVNAEFRLDSPNGSVLATVSCLPTGGNTYSGAVPTNFADITESNWRTVGFSSKADQDGEFDLSKFNRGVWDYARSQNEGIHDIYVSFSYDRTPAMNQQHIDQASHSGVSVVYVGTATANATAAYAPFRVCNEGSDRPNIKFPAGQDYLVNAVAEKTHAAGGKVVVVIQSVGVMDISAFVDNVDAIIWTAYNGQRQGEAHSRLILGDYNPSGNLTQTWYTDDSQLYPYPASFLTDYSIDNRDDKVGRTYMYFKGTPRYPFGFGLSYTNFTIGNVQIADPADGIITVSADVTNNTAVPGAEVVQVYVEAPGHGDGVNPSQQLKGFARVELGANETKQAEIQLEVKDLMVIDPSTVSNTDVNLSGVRKLMPGGYNVKVCYDSATPVANGARTINLTEADTPLKLKVVTLRTDKPVATSGEMFNSNVTICLTDETFLDPNAPGLSISYESSNPANASVDPDTGVISAIKGGTSLITATFTYNDQVLEASYPVVVVNVVSLSELNINGQLIDGYRYNRFLYDVKLPVDTTEIPVITASAPDDCLVEYAAAAKVPGSTFVTVTRGSETASYEISFSYSDYEVELPEEKLIAAGDGFANRGPWSTTSSSNGMYADWANLDGQLPIDLLHYSNRDGLYLTLTMEFHSPNEERPFSDVLRNATGGSNSLRLRSSDLGNKPGDPYLSQDPNNSEHNFGWRISSQWNLQWGKNYIRIPLSSVVGKTLTSNSDRDVPMTEYMINVNGVDVLARETSRGLLDWSDIRRMILMIFADDNSHQTAPISMSLGDIKIVDTGVFIGHLDETVATFNTFAARTPLYNNMYADWTSPDPGSGIAVVDGGNVKLDLGNHNHKDKLYLTFTLTMSSTHESERTLSSLMTSGSNSIRLRSPDQGNKPGAPSTGSEHNFGWRPTAAWGLTWGTNYVSIPLGKPIDSAVTTNSDTYPENYTINVNGVEVPVRECHLGLIDWKYINRIIMMIFVDNKLPDEIITMTLEDVMIIDGTIKELTSERRAALESLMTPKIPQDGYADTSYNAYLDAYDKVDKIKSIADWPTPLMYSIGYLQQAIDGLEFGTDPDPDPNTVFSADFTDSTAQIRNRSGGILAGSAIAAVYDKSGVLRYSEAKPFNITSGDNANIDFDLDFAAYPQEDFNYKVFFWDNYYRPLTEAITN
jgi:beta-glucosidase-like glycosyl hydrolase